MERVSLPIYMFKKSTNFKLFLDAVAPEEIEKR